MRTLVLAAAAILVALAAATSVTVIVEQASKPDRNVNFDDANPPNPWADPSYGQR